MIDAQHLCAFAREGQRSGAAVAHAFAGALAGADDDGDLVLQAHVSSLRDRVLLQYLFVSSGSLSIFMVASTRTTPQ